MKSSARGAIVAVAICSWFAISNHCAFAGLATKTDPAQATCPFHSKPAKQDKQSTGAQCCKILRAIASAQTKSWNRDDTNSSRVDLSPKESVGAERLRLPLAPQFLDTGPPRAHSFAELILQRSLFANAPPHLA
jgi:hypothetical protein